MLSRLLPILLFVPLVGASQGTWTDPAGDVVHETTGYPAPPPYPWSPDAADILAWEIRETPATIALDIAVELAAPVGDGRNGPSSLQLTMDGEWQGRPVQVSILLTNDEGAIRTQAVLQFLDKMQEEAYEHTMLDSWMETPTRVRVTVPMAAFEPPFRVGDRIEDLRLRALIQGHQSTFPPTDSRFVDLAPDDQRIDLAPTFGITPSATLGIDLFATQRASNGGQPLFLFDVPLQHRGTSSIHVRPLVEDLPPGWRVETLVDALELPPGASARLPFVLHVPSAHVHGGTSTFTVDLGHGAAVELGLHFLTIAQPAGHHPRLDLYAIPLPFHDAPDTLLDRPESKLVMATAPPPESHEAMVQGTSTHVSQAVGPQGVPSHYEWEVPLHEGLLLGLAATGAPATARLQMAHPVGATVDVTATLSVATPGRSTLLAQGTTHAVALGPEPLGFDVEMPWNLSSMRVPVQDGAQLILHVLAAGPVMSAGLGPDHAVRLDSQGAIDLPLLEYVDTLTMANSNLSVEARSVVGLAQGAQALENVTLRNSGVRAREVQLLVQGDAARLLGPPEVEVPASGQVVRQVAITAPARAFGQVPVVVIALDASDGTLAAAEIVVRESPGSTRDDADAIAKLEKGGARSPLPVAWLILAALVGAWGARATQRLR